MTSIAFRAVSKAYGSNPPVLRGVDLEIGDGELAVFIGPSGCGKSTLLRLVAGLEEITSGDIFIGGRLVNKPPRPIAASPWSSRAADPLRQSHGLDLVVRHVDLAGNHWG
ncbi:MAG TPA: ATP-binding cassette domain-containing protein [Anaeromyxobacter sp.]|nr:ATP-binding cassette domain-containing protein [Anaeromyxobacter sp.]HVO21623.1 ATP-binding cassette domain-containing protein [Anaeromyxobacter sp.]